MFKLCAKENCNVECVHVFDGDDFFRKIWTEVLEKDISEARDEEHLECTVVRYLMSGAKVDVNFIVDDGIETKCLSLFVQNAEIYVNRNKDVNIVIYMKYEDFDRISYQDYSKIKSINRNNF